MIEQMRIQLLREGAAVPARATAGSGGYDLTACLTKPMNVYPGHTSMLPTGIAIELPAGYVALIFARSGLAAKHGVAPANAVGVIDSDYRGEIIVPLICHHIDCYTVQPGERIAQLVIVPVETPALTVSDSLSDTGRGPGGFGSTGRA